VVVQPVEHRRSLPSGVSVERLFGPNDMGYEAWMLSTSLRLGSNSSLTDWVDPTSLGPWPEEVSRPPAAEGSWKSSGSWKSGGGSRKRREPRPVTRFLGCANPRCFFLVHRSEEYGGFCCRRCHKEWDDGGAEPQHGIQCQKEQLGEEPRAEPAPPTTLYGEEKERTDTRSEVAPPPSTSTRTEVAPPPPSAVRSVPSPVTSVDQKEPRQKCRLLRCARPFCQFLVHSSAEYGGFCCRKCYGRFANPGKKCSSQNKHGDQCERQEHGGDEAIAEPIPPTELPTAR